MANLDLMYRELYMGASYSISFSGMKAPVRAYVQYSSVEGKILSEEWSIGESNFDLRLGYRVRNTPRLGITPYACVGQESLQFRHKDMDYSRVTLLWGAGVFCDLKLGKTILSAVSGSRESYRAVRIGYRFTCPRYGIRGLENSIMHNLTVEFGGLWGSIRRRAD